jgi:hypothetical protein
MYEPTGKEKIEKTTEKAPCGNIVTTKYFLDGALVRQDKEVIVDAEFMMNAFARI